MLGQKGSTKVGGRGGALWRRAGWCLAAGAIALCALLLAVVPVGEGGEEGRAMVAQEAASKEVASAAPLVLQLVPDGIDPSQVDSILGAVVLPASALPPFDPRECRIDLAAITRDEDIALLSLPAGTDDPDYRLDGGAGDRIVVVERGVVEVPGNLWTDAKAKPLVLMAREDVTVWVRGKLYLQRPIRVEGPGRVTIMHGPEMAGKCDEAAEQTSQEKATQPGPWLGPALVHPLPAGFANPRGNHQALYLSAPTR